MRWLAIVLLALPLAAQSPQQREAREILQQLIAINTTDASGDNTRAAEAMAARFREAGFPAADVRVLGPRERKGNLVARLRGTGAARPVLFIGHLDVVEALRSDWSMEPFQLIEKDGWLYGRGTADMKGDDSVLVSTFLRLKREGFRPSRDMILALTSDEEGGTANGVEWLLKEHRDLVDAEFCVNPDSGGGHLKNGKRIYLGVQAAEKVFFSVKLEVTNAGGHSSRPSRDNAIYHLAEGLARLAKFDFPVRLFDVTRASFEKVAPIQGGQLGADLKAVGQNPNDSAAIARLGEQPFWNAQLRTTCVATMLSGGHAENALPQTASAVVNCRILPVDNAAEVQNTLVKVLADPQIKLSVLTAAKPVKFTPMNPTVLAAVTAAAQRLWPGIPIVPEMDTGASDGVHTISAGIPTYGVSGLFNDEDDNRYHGRDERILLKAYLEDVDFMYDLATRLAK
jgi:acetylornithine deacetylase/succinyl-diaminopimelate desuccinylase-like protein